MLLIDSGADVTLLPRNSINSLGIGTLSNEGYELMSFDGSVRNCQKITWSFLTRLNSVVPLG
jgi:hypothetical protein